MIDEEVDKLVIGEDYKSYFFEEDHTSYENMGRVLENECDLCTCRKAL
jgi:hypothetical protein